MKKTIFLFSLMIVAIGFLVSCGGDDPAPEAELTSFTVTSPVSGIGIIDNTARTITVNVPFGTDLTNVVATVVITDGATITPDPSAGVDLSSLSVDFTVINGGTSTTYTLNVIVGENPLRIVLLGDAATINDLNGEERAAYEWAIDTYNDPVVQYMTWDEVATADLTTTKAIWIHHHLDGPPAGVDPNTNRDYGAMFPSSALSSATTSALTTYYQNGGDFLLTGMAHMYLEVLGRLDAKWGANQFWGGEGLAENGDNWGFAYQGGFFEDGQFPSDNNDYYLFNDLQTSTVSFEGVDYPAVFLVDGGFKYDDQFVWLFHLMFNPNEPSYNGEITIEYPGDDPNATKAEWENQTSAKVRGTFEWDPAAGGVELGTIVEFEPTGDWSGTSMVIASAAYEWYAPNGPDVDPNAFIGNVQKITQNAIDRFLE